MGTSRSMLEPLPACMPLHPFLSCFHLISALHVAVVASQAATTMTHALHDYVEDAFTPARSK
jgi:hypothetical protein